MHCFGASAQTGWDSWQNLYADSNMTVELQFFYSESSCEDGGKPFKYRYRLNGIMTEEARYVVWKMDYINCHGGSTYEMTSLAIGGLEEMRMYGQDKLVDMVIYDPLSSKFICKELIQPYYDVVLSEIRMAGTGDRMGLLSEDPMGIAGKQSIFSGQSTTLSVKGGTLGQGADWIWYKDSCGLNWVGTGETITVQPSEKTTYFVRAEGTINCTGCSEITILVDLNSKAPAGIKADEKICKGDSATLKVLGGRLGVGAEWIWHSGGCNGPRIGTGSSIKVNPSETTEYYVNAEGTTNITDCASILVEVMEPSVEPKQIILTGSNIICEGEKVKLRVSGGNISNGSKWFWYQNDCGGIALDSGNQVELMPLNTTSYFVRGEGYCNKTNCVSIGITVNKKSVLGNIESPEHVFRSRKTTLSVKDGTLGKNAQWLWYKGSCSNGKPIGKGPSLKVRTRIPTKYYVKAEGLCNETKCQSIVVEPLKCRQWDHKYSPNKPMYTKYKKFLQVGLSAGGEWLQFRDYGKVLTTSSNGVDTRNDSAGISIKGVGLKFEAPVYFFAKDRFSLGVIPGYSFGYLPKFVAGNLDKDNEESLFYQRIQLETELAFGLEPLKILVKLKRGYELNVYRGTESTPGSDGNQFETSSYTYEKNLNREVLTLGLRFGSHSLYENYKQKNTLDLVSTFSRTNINDLRAFAWNDYAHLTEWNFGGGVVWWRQKLKFQFNVTFHEFQKFLDYKPVNYKGALYELSFAYNYKWFY
jgi:hypothetical protein